MNKDPDIISSVLDFFSKKLDKSIDNKKKTKEILQIEKGEGKVMFYLVKYKEFDNKSLLEYIDSQNVRLSRQREELIDLSVKIANLNHRQETGGVNSERAMEEVVNHYKSDLPSGVGLRDKITMIRERYPWSSSKKKIMIFVSLMTCLLGIGLYILDLTTDVRFSLEMFNKTDKDVESFNVTFKSFLTKNGFKFPSNVSHSRALECLTDLEVEIDIRDNSTLDVSDNRDYRVTGWISLWHCVQPFVVTMIVFLSMKFLNEGKCSVPNQPANFKKKEWWCFSSVLCCIPNLAYLGSLVPIPALTHLYRFYLDLRSHHARSTPEFRTKIVSIEDEIREHEALGKLWKIQS